MWVANIFMKVGQRSADMEVNVDLYWDRINAISTIRRSTTSVFLEITAQIRAIVDINTRMIKISGLQCFTELQQNMFPRLSKMGSYPHPEACSGQGFTLHVNSIRRKDTPGILMVIKLYLNSGWMSAEWKRLLSSIKTTNGNWTGDKNTILHLCPQEFCHQNLRKTVLKTQKESLYLKFSIHRAMAHIAERVTMEDLWRKSANKTKNGLLI